MRKTRMGRNIRGSTTLVYLKQRTRRIGSVPPTVGITGSHASGDRVRPAFVGSGQGRRNPSAFRQW